MAKGDFNVEEPKYYENSDENQKEEKKQVTQKQEKKDIYHQDYGENSDFSNIGLSKDLDYIDNSSVVFEDKENQTPKEKLNYFLSTLNKKALIVLAAIILLFLIILIIILSYISKNNASYYSKVITPEIVYMGETGNISVVANGKEDLENTTTTFTSKNTKVVTLLNEELTGKNVLNTIIPIQEGRAKIEIKSNLKNRKMAEETREIVVCPAFNSDLLLTENISIVKDSTYTLTTDFGEEECSKDIVFESSNESIITVNEEGRLTGINIGEAILTLRKGSRSISVNVEVTKEYVELKTLDVTPSKVQLKPGENTRIKLNYAPANATSSSFIFTNENSDIAEISEGGLITALKPGTTTIEVKSINGGATKQIEVIVSEEVSSEGTEVTEMKLDKTNINLVQGNSEKIMATVTPDNAKDKTITWKSSDESIATVTNQGVVLAKKAGTVDITASTNNNISRTVRVVVTKMKSPVISSSDNIETNQWHNKSYVLKFSGSESGVTYYYGKTEDQMDNKGSRVTISKDEKATYYVKACKNNVCSEIVNYISKLDTTKPQVLTVAGIENTAVSEDSVQIALKDITSLVQKWCVTTVDNASTCKWKTIQTMSNPVVTYTAKYNATYFVFAKDTAGNISDSYAFEIANIE